MNDTTLPVGAPFGSLPERSSDAASPQGDAAAAPAARKPLAVPGEHLGPWLVTRPLPGDSPNSMPGAAEVYVAGRANGEPRTLVALRVQAVDDAQAMLQQLTRVRQALARLPSQHWARVVDAGSATEGRVYVATELVEGVPVAQAMRSLSLPDRLRLLLPWLDALADAHRLLLVHGALRASALRVTPAAPPVKRYGAFRLSPAEPEAPALGQVRAFGLGLAQALNHADGPPIDTAADIRALGRLLHELLEGAPMDDADDADGAPPSSELPLDLRAIIERALVTWRVDELAPHESASLYARSGYAHVDALAADLRAFLDGFPVAAQPATRRYQAWRFVGRQPLASALGGAVALALVLAWVGGAWQAVRATTAQHAAEARLDALRGLTRQAVLNHAEALPTGSSAAAEQRDALVAELAALEREAGDDDEWRAMLAGAHARLAEQLTQGLRLRPDNAPIAAVETTRALALAEQAWAARQHDPALVAAYALALQLRARALAQRAERPQALALLDDALGRVDRALAAVDEGARRPLRARRAALMLDQARLQAEAGLPDQALGLFEQVELALKTLVQAQAEPALMAQLAELHGARARILQRQGQAGRARADSVTAMQWRQGALQARPEHSAWREALVHDGARAARLLMQDGQDSEALAASTQAWDEAQALQRSFGKTETTQALLAEAAQAHGPALVAAGRVAEALPVLDPALAALDKALANGPDQALERQRAGLQLAQARARLAGGDRSAALGQLTALSGTLEPLTEPAGQADTREAWLMLGEVRWLLSGLEPRRRAEWQQRAVAAYTQAHALQALSGEALKHFQQAGGRL